MSQFLKGTDTKTQRTVADKDGYNYDKIREGLRVKYSPPRNFVTMHMQNYQPYQVGVSKQAKKNHEPNLSCFVGGSSY